MEDKISVIIPVYKVECYLKRCVESVRNQTYRNLEIILVDDGSPDSCPQLCDEMAGQDERIKVIHKENGGLSSARNAGIRAASGKYIGFVDSDDYILPEMYEKMYRTMQEDGSDLCVCGFQYVDEDGTSIGECKGSKKERELLTREQAYERFNPDKFQHVCYVTAWSKLYIKECFTDILFPEGRIHEDEFIAHHIFEKCKTVSVVRTALYMYVQRDGSIVNSRFSIRRLDGIFAFIDRCAFFRERNQKELAEIWLNNAYRYLTQYIDDVNGNKTYIMQFWPAVYLVMKEMYHSGNLYAIKQLMIVWMKYVFGSIVGKKRTPREM